MQSSEFLHSHLVVLLDGQNSVAFGRQADAPWSVKHIKGELLCSVSSRPLCTILKELSNQLNCAEQLRQVQVDLLYGMGGTDALPDAPKCLAGLQCESWQILRLEPLLEQVHRQWPMPQDWDLGQLDKESSLLAWILEHVLPKLEDRQDLPVEAQALEEDACAPVAEPPLPRTGSLKEQLRRLEQQNQALKAQLSAAAPPDAECLLSFLPALYEQVFTVFSGADLAALIGRVEPFDIPSPYPEWSEEALNKKQRDFLSLPKVEQLKVLRFAQSASHRLKPRKRMRAHLDDLEA